MENRDGQFAIAADPPETRSLPPEAVPARLGVKVGTLIARKYRIDRVLGHGGAGVVFAATHTSLNQQVALKLLLKSDRFRREALAGATAAQEHTVTVIDEGTHGGHSYILMELLHGMNLQEALAQRRKLPVSEAADYVVQACHGLAYAHAHAIVHRDVKPANLFLHNRSDGTTTLKLLDFSHAKILDSGEALTREGEMLGTLVYMSPEQYHSPRNVGPATDLWALGIVLFELLTGRRPFAADNEWSESDRIRKGVPDDLAAVDPTVPPEICRVIGDCLQKDPEERRRRVPDVASLAERLAPFCSATFQDYPSRINTIFREAQSPPPNTTSETTDPSAKPVLSGVVHGPTLDSEQSAADPARLATNEHEVDLTSLSGSVQSEAPEATVTPEKKPRRWMGLASIAAAAIAMAGVAAIASDRVLPFFQDATANAPADTATPSAATTDGEPAAPTATVPAALPETRAPLAARDKPTSSTSTPLPAPSPSAASITHPATKPASANRNAHRASLTTASAPSSTATASARSFARPVQGQVSGFGPR